DTGDSGQPVDRNFCPECGSPIISDVAVMPELRLIKAGTLDDTSWLDPKMQVYCDSAEHWASISESSQKFGKMPAYLSQQAQNPGNPRRHEPRAPLARQPSRTLS